MSRKQPIVLEAFTAGLRSFRWVALALFAVYFCSGITVVQPGEVALVLRLGKLEGATPLAADKMTAGVPLVTVEGTANVSVPPPILLMLRVPCATPGLQLSCARNTVVDCGIRIG